jgi:hypothetical protein
VWRKRERERKREGEGVLLILDYIYIQYIQYASVKMYVHITWTKYRDCKQFTRPDGRISETIVK